MAFRRSRLGVFVFGVLLTSGWSSTFAQSPRALTDAERKELDQGRQALQTSLDGLRDRSSADKADAAVFAKGLDWALRYDHEFTGGEVNLMKRAIVRGQQRVAALVDGKTAWKSRKGKVALAYVSRVDGSVQPYGLYIPKGYETGRPMRLDVVLHGSSKPVGLSELKFINRFDVEDDEREAAKADAAAPDQSYFELHPLGRIENCYRYAGETDVFEAIDDVCRRYAIDRNRIVLRGMSMGGSGTWHLGLKHPDRFVALGPYCGYVDTHRFSETPMSTFVKVGELPVHQELGLHFLDSVDYAGNAGVVPAIACMGEKDPFFQAHVLMGEAMRREGVAIVNLVSPGTAHVVDPVTFAEQMRWIGFAVARGNPVPPDLRFVTWTLKYGKCHWLEVQGLDRHYARAELSARLRGEVIEFDEPKNISRFAIATKTLPARPQKLRVGGTELAVAGSNVSASGEIVVMRRDGRWQIAEGKQSTPITGKRPGQQGPIDDAFSEPFLCVRGTRKGWNPAVQAYADAALARFAEEWRHYFRGELPVKDDTAVTDDDVRTRHLVLFGDPGSNSLIAKALPRLPLTWSKERLKFAGEDVAATDHLPALIVASPLPGGESRYLVLNSGHTFREAELAKLNYLLFPRWGDWAVLKIDATHAAGAPAEEAVVKAGFFDEEWRVPTRN